MLEIQCVFCDVISQLDILGSSIHIAIKIHFWWGVTLCSCANIYRRFESSYYLPKRQEILSRPTFRVKYPEDGGTGTLRNVINYSSSFKTSHNIKFESSGTQLLGTFAKIVKSDCWLLHVSLSLRMEIGSHCTDFREVLYSSIFFKSVEKNSSIIKIWHEKRLIYKKQCELLWYIAQLFLQWEMFWKKSCRKNQNTHF